MATLSGSFKPSATSAASEGGQRDRTSFAIVTSLFFVWGFITCMNDLLIPKFKAAFELTQFQANLVQFAFFGAYFCVSLLYFILSATKGDPINRIGYKNGLVLGLGVAGLGCLLFYPAAQLHLYWLFLGALLILGSGVTLIQIAANPYISILGPQESAPSRLNLSQGLCSLGYVIAPLVGGLLLFGTSVYQSAGGVDAVKKPYLGLAVAFFALAATFKLIKLPGFQNTEKVTAGVRAFRHKHFFWGWLAIFFYVGSEVTVGSILINYLGEVMGLSHMDADKYLSFYWGGLMIGRLMGAIAMGNIRASMRIPWMAVSAIVSTLIIFASATFKQKLTSDVFINPMDVLPYIVMIVLCLVFFMSGGSRPGRTVGIFAAVAAALTVCSMSAGGAVALWSLIGIGLFNSIMWSNIFTLSIRDLGDDTPQGSSLLVMMIVGGALMPLIQGALMDRVGVRLSLSIVLVGYAYLMFFGFFAWKFGSAAADGDGTLSQRQS